MRITKVYTRTGDGGETSLAGGQRVSKDDIRIEAFGTVDELNAVIGLTRAFGSDLAARNTVRRRLDNELDRIQNRLFDVGAILATLPETRIKKIPNITAGEVRHLEKLMDSFQKDLKPLEEFILPGGGKVAGFLHQGRTVCRRAERLCVRLACKEPVPAEIIQYLNRLSDALFVFARWVAQAEGQRESLWKRK